MLYDLHLHSVFSDGDNTPSEIADLLVQHNVAGGAITDHNGIWTNSKEHSLNSVTFIEGIEISAEFERTPVHLLGYALAFDRAILAERLQVVRRGYEERIRKMVERCHYEGYDRVSFHDIIHRRQGQDRPVFTTYDVAKELHEKYGVSSDESRRLTTGKGSLHVGYGRWALTVIQALNMIREAGGIAVLAHPGTITYEASPGTLQRLLDGMHDHLDGIEVWHPFNDEQLIIQLEALCQSKRYLATGGSDWHGEGRYHEEALGTWGVDEVNWKRIQQALASRSLS